jgi:hypothetical protein
VKAKFLSKEYGEKDQLVELVIVLKQIIDKRDECRLD